MEWTLGYCKCVVGVEAYYKIRRSLAQRRKGAKKWKRQERARGGGGEREDETVEEVFFGADARGERQCDLHERIVTEQLAVRTHGVSILLILKIL